MNRRRRPRFAFRLLSLCMLILALGVAASAEWKEKVLYSFQGGADGAYPAGGVVFDKQGNLYGATQQGGGTNCSPMAACGTVYQLVPPAKKGDPWTENVLHVFQGKQHNDGEFPSGGVIADASGNIYGTSSYGGTGDCVLLGIKGGCGTVFELSPPQTKAGTWTYTILYSFKGGKDGYLPFGDLVFDSAGNLYGATYFGGGKGTTCDPDYYQYCGTVFELSPPRMKGGKWAEKVLYSFAGGTDGANPNGGLVLDIKGAVYGTTANGGNQGCKTASSIGCGTAFELRPSETGGRWVEKQLHVFAGGPRDTGVPDAGLIFDGKGNLYGTTFGGTNTNSAVFSLTPPAKGAGAWRETLLVDFNNCGGYFQCGPSGLMFDSLGNLYSATNVVFRMNPPKKGGRWTLTALHKFQGPPDGRSPTGMIFGQASAIYGATLYGGTGQQCQGGCGIVFEVSP